MYFIPATFCLNIPHADGNLLSVTSLLPFMILKVIHAGSGLQDFPSLCPHAPSTTTTHTHTHTHALTEAVVLYDREKEDDDELSGEMGDVITVVEQVCVVSGTSF